MRKLLLLSALALVLGILPTFQADASWGFLTYHIAGSWAYCSGEPDGWGDDECDVTTSWGTRVQTVEFGGKCAASIWCPGEIVVIKTCLAGTTWQNGTKPAICFATSSNGGMYKAECKSDSHGAWALRCDD
ncbi:MAG TPA: hypothetical protein VKU40_03185 [Thermoanaerobaculia bacterium]|nr:hypothetical protein [Thermoanaerobaculia bacterium]